MKKLSKLITNEKLKKNKDRSGISDNTVTKSNSLTRAHYKFSLTEKRIMEALISKINPICADKQQLQDIVLTAQEYADAFSVDLSNAYSDISNAASSLLRKVFIALRDGNKFEFTLMSSAEYDDTNKKITCTFNPIIANHLTGIGVKFTSYSLAITAGFKSAYTWRIYELIVSWGKEKDGVFCGWFLLEMDDLIKMLSIPESYRWIHIRDKILVVAEKELKNEANIHLKINPKKTGKKITSLKFIFNKIDEDKK